MAEFGIGAAFLASSAGASAYYATGKTDLTLTIDNQLQGVRLTLPVLFIDGGKRIEDPTSEIASQTSMTAKFKKKTTSSELSGALVYELQHESEDPYRFYVFVAWKAFCHRSTRIYTRLLFDRSDATCSVDRLKDVYQKLSHHFVKTRDDGLVQSYPFQNGSSIGLKSHCTGKKHRELLLTITDDVSQADDSQPLWIGPSVDAQEAGKISLMKKTVKAFVTMTEAIETVEKIQRIIELGTAGAGLLACVL
jgi:hypothetical protein